jgi:hypothetical protein
MTKAIVPICLLATMLVSGRGAFAQAGSVGGTIGKTDKSVSGSEEEAGGPRPSPKPGQSRPVTARSRNVAINLAGRWSCNDGGTYTIRQSGSKLSWEGVSGDGGKSWSHSFRGVIQNNIIEGNFTDHPPGAMRGSGPLKIKVVDANRMEMLRAGTLFGGSAWTRVR